VWASVIDVKRVSRAPSSSSSLHKQRAQQDRKGERTRRGGTRKQPAEEVNAKLFFSIDFFLPQKAPRCLGESIICVGRAK
jgi:hypothetical protein